MGILCVYWSCECLEAVWIWGFLFMLFPFYTLLLSEGFFFVVFLRWSFILVAQAGVQ